MSRPDQFRRALVVLKSGAGSPAVPAIGNRSLHQYWALLKTHFRGILLAPQSLSDGASTQWTWREPVDTSPLTTAELATARKRLTGAQRSFADSVEDAAEPVVADARRAGSVLPQLQAHMDAVVTALIAQPDAALAAYLVRSEQGLLLHSWGLPSALPPHYPDNTTCEIAGTVFVTDQPAADREVLLENSDGTILDRTHSDMAGCFRFSKISPGRYRARVLSDRETFPPEGVIVEMERTSVTGLELRDRTDDRRAVAQGAGSGQRRAVPFILIGSLALILVAIVWWRSSNSPASASTSTTAQSTAPTNLAPKTIARVRVDPTETTTPSVQAASGQTAAVESPSARAPKTESPPRESKRRPTVVTEQRTAGLGAGPSGAPANATPPAAAVATSTAHSSAAGNRKSGAGASSSGNVSSLSAATTSEPTVPAISASRNTTASASAAIAATKRPAPPPAQPTPPPPPKPAAAATPSSSPTPSPSPEPETEPEQVTASAKADSAISTASPSTANEPDSSVDNSPVPAPSYSPLDNPSADPAPPSDQNATTISVTTTIDSESTPPRTSSSDGDPAGAAIPITSAAHHPLRVRLRIAPWRTRLLQDTILPTAPTRVGDDDAIEALRERLFRERHTQIPFLFKPPVTRIGFVIELPTDTSGPLRARWRNTPDATTAHLAVVAGRAEISWSGNPPADTTGALLTDDGHELARVTADQHGIVTLVAIAGVRGWPWIGIERPAADDARLTTTDWNTRLEWRVLSGAPAAPTWHRDDHWLNGHGHRLDLIPGVRASGPMTHALALLDRVTGWALVSEIELAQETPATAVSLSR